MKTKVVLHTVGASTVIYDGPLDGCPLTPHAGQTITRKPNDAPVLVEAVQEVFDAAEDALRIELFT